MDTLKKHDFSHYETLSHRYELRECLAVASVGLLYRARDVQATSDSGHAGNKPDVFVHVLPDDFAGSIAMASQLQQLNRTLREAALPAILTVREFGRDRDKVFAVLDYPDARLHVLDSQQVNNERGLVAQMAEGLSRLHRYDLTHGGLEAQVFLVSDQGNVYVWGTGVMAVMCRNQSSRCMEDSPYLSPERYLGVEPRRRDDIYALGVQLYYWKTGRWPYQSSNAVQARENDEHPIPVSEFSAFSDAQWDLLKSALALDARQRPAHIAALAGVYDEPQSPALPLWQWGAVAAVLLGGLGVFYAFMQSDVRGTFAEPSPRQVAMPAERSKALSANGVTEAIEEVDKPETSETPEAVPVVEPQVVTTDVADVTGTADEPEATEALAEPPAVEPVVVTTAQEPVKLYLQDAPEDTSAETALAETVTVAQSQADAEGTTAVVEEVAETAETTTVSEQTAGRPPARSVAEPAIAPVSRIAWSAPVNPPVPAAPPSSGQTATTASTPREREVFFGGESVYPPTTPAPSAARAQRPSPAAASASTAHSSGSASRDLRGIPLSRWTAHELSLRANQALRAGRLDEEANRGAVYFIRHLKRHHRGHPDIKRLAGGVVSALHKRAQAQLAQRQKLQMGRTLFFAKKFIKEFNLVGYNRVQEKLEHEHADLPRLR